MIAIHPDIDDNLSTRLKAFIRSLDNPLLDMDYRPGLERVRQMLSHLSLHQPKLRIRIAGTNGKGSTGHFLEHAFRASGLKTGFYTSPHMLSFNERIRIESIPASDKILMPQLSKILDLGEEYGASPFELATALAINTFSREDVDVEILECGLGARLDATTAIPADMAIITPIALDHQAWLGNTLDEIAAEKAFVMKGCRWFISALQVDKVAQVLLDFNPGICFTKPDKGEWNRLKTLGQHQRINANLAYAAVKMLCNKTAIKIDLKQAQKAISNCTVPGRLQYCHIDQADIWLDAAHNRHAIEALLPSLKTLADPFDAILVFTRQDRSLNDSLALLEPYAKRLISNHLDATLSPAGVLHDEITSNPDGKFLVLGSFTTVAAILRSLRPG